MGGADAFVQASWATTSMTGSDEVIAIPWFVDVRALAYRADLLEQVGLTPEEAFADLDAFEATLKRIKEADLGVAPFSHTGRGDWNVVQNAAMFMWNFGAEILSPDLTTAVFNSPEAVAGVHMQTRFFGEGLTPPDAPGTSVVLRGELGYADLDGRAISVEAQLALTYAREAEVLLAPIYKELLARASEVELATAAARALRLERAGQREEARSTLVQALAAAAVYTPAQVTASYSELAGRMEQGLSEADRKQAQFASYKTRQSRG